MTGLEQIDRSVQIDRSERSFYNGQNDLLLDKNDLLQVQIDRSNLYNYLCSK